MTTGYLDVSKTPHFVGCVVEGKGSEDAVPSALLYSLRRVAGYGHKLWQLEICPIM